MTLETKSFKIAVFAVKSVVTFNVSSIASAFFNNIPPIKILPIIPANLLQIPMILIRFAADSIGPITLT